MAATWRSRQLRSKTLAMQAGGGPRDADSGEMTPVARVTPKPLSARLRELLADVDSLRGHGEAAG